MANTASSPPIPMEITSTTTSEDDEVVQEFDVFLSKALTQRLALLQYHLRPIWRPYNKDKLATVRMKPKTEKLEMDFVVDTDSEHYDADNPNQTPKFTLTSSSVPPKTSYAIGVLRGDQLHLTPLSGIYQMRPSFTYLDDADEKLKAAEGAAAAEDAEGESADVAPAEEFQQLTVTFKRRETARTRAARQRSHAYLKQQEEEEEWRELQYHDTPDVSSETAAVFEKLFTTTKKPVEFDMTRRQYVLALTAVPEPVPPSASPAPNMAGRPLPIGRTLEEQLRNFFLEMFGRYGVCSLSFLKSNLAARQRAGGGTATNLLAGGVPDPLFHSVLKNIATYMHSAYFVTSVNPRVDKYRNVIIDLFRAKMSIKKSDIMEELEKRGLAHKESAPGATPTETPQSLWVLLQRILRELAYAKNNQWIFKDGNNADAQLQ